LTLRRNDELAVLQTAENPAHCGDADSILQSVSEQLVENFRINCRIRQNYHKGLRPASTAQSVVAIDTDFKAENALLSVQL
jgi:hypothetical protein